jgi:outer membrane protein assembly factor BamA
VLVWQAKKGWRHNPKRALRWKTGCALLGLAASVGGSQRVRAQVPASQGVPVASPASPGGLTAKVPQASAAAATPQNADASQPEQTVPPLSSGLPQFAGLQVTAIRYEGVDFDKSDKLLAELSQKAGEPLDPEKVRQTTRRLFATGRYRDIAVRVRREGDGVTLIFAGVPRFYVGRVQIVGVKDGRLASLLEDGTKLNPGVPYTPADAESGLEAVKETLKQNGYFEPVVSVRTERDDAGQQVNLTYTVAIGPLARVGTVTVNGKDPGIMVAEFRKKGKLKAGSKVNRETVSTALDDLRKFFQKKDRLEATVAMRKSTYDAAKDTLNYDFDVEQGPIVKVEVEGAKFSKSRLHLLVPVFEEGTVDTDLLNEGTFNLKDYLQQKGYFDAVVHVKVENPTPGQEVVLFSVDKGQSHKVVDVEVTGNKYFTSELLKESLKVQKADNYDRSGRFSTELVKQDEKDLEAIYRANGFSLAKVTGTYKDVDKGSNGRDLAGAGGADQASAAGQRGTAVLAVDAFGRPRRHPELLPVERLRRGAGGGKPDGRTRRQEPHGYRLQRDRGAAGVCRQGAGERHSLHAAEDGGSATARARGRSSGPERAADDAAQPLQPGPVQRGECGGAESVGRRRAEECAGTDHRGQALGYHLRLRLRGADRAALLPVLHAGGYHGRAGGQGRGQPAGLAGRDTHQPARDG